MARHDDASTYADLLACLGDDGTKELFRRLLEHALQDLIGTELTSRIGAPRHERSESRSNWRNGHGPEPCRRRQATSSCGSRKSGWGRSSRRCSRRAAG